MQEEQANEKPSSDVPASTMKTRTLGTMSLTQAREAAYKEIAKLATEKAKFMLQLRCCCNGIGDSEQDDEIISAIIAFVTTQIQLDVIKKMLVMKRSMAFARAMGFQYMRVFLRNYIKLPRFPSRKYSSLLTIHR
jgi:hypothetical protein